MNVLSVEARLALAGLLLMLAGCHASASQVQGPGSAGPESEEELALLEHARTVLAPLKSDGTADGEPPARVELGRRLFFEPRLSVDGRVSCATCHPPERHGADGLRKSVGVFGRGNPRNAPSVLHAALHATQHWRGDRASLEEQAERSLVGKASFGNGREEEVMTRLAEYGPLFQAAFPEEAPPWGPGHLARAVGAYEQTLPRRSRFDDYLEGRLDALSAAERRGLREFLEVGCASCHGGVGVGGLSLQRFGLVEPYWEATGSTERDRGRADVTGRAEDEYLFKVPGLRNVAKTAPYFHDGSVESLPAAVEVMARVQLGRRLSPEQVASIVTFLGSLTSPVPDTFSHKPDEQEGIHDRPSRHPHL